MTQVKGCIDTIDHRGITGWATAGLSDNNDTRYVRVHVNGVELGTICANLFRADLFNAKISNGNSGFRFLFPTPPNPLIDHVIEVRDRDTGAPLTPCPATLKSLLRSTGDDSMLEFDKSLATTHIRSASLLDGCWTFQAELIGPEKLAFEPSVRNGKIQTIHVKSEPDEFMTALGIQRRIGTLEIRPNDQDDVAFLELLPDRSTAGKYDTVCSLAFPTRIPDYLAEISQENMTRVAGPAVTRDLFAVGGVNTAYRINSLLNRHFGRGLNGFEHGLDWGIGAGRVALPIKRIIAPRLQLSGSDVDEYNIAYGNAKYPDIEFVQSPLYPPLPFEDHKFDFAYGISVVTHLTEGAQFAWLKELHRIVKPGAPVILTVHGEYAILNAARLNPAIFSSTSTWGISDQMPDANLGPKLRDKSYYRSTFHTRKYVARAWAEHFDILGHYSCANVVVQDFVILRAK